MAMGRQTPSRICSRQVGHFILLLSLTFIDTSHCNWRPTSGGFSNNQWTHRQINASRYHSAAAAGSGKPKQGAELTIHHRPGHSNWTARLLETLEHDRYRLQAIRSRLSASAAISLESGLKYGSPNFVVRMEFGTPPRSLLLMLDTGSLTWIQCKPCSGCHTQVDPIFDPKQSSSFKTLGCRSPECKQLDAIRVRRWCLLDRGCRYGIEYDDGSKSFGYFSQDTLRVGSHSFPKFNFGCSRKYRGVVKGAAGSLALGAQMPSFPAQTASAFQGSFSYCLPDFANPDGVGSLTLGPPADPSSSSGVVFTALLRNSWAPSYYYVGLSGISLGSRRLNIPREMFGEPEEGGGTIVDCGSMATYLVRSAYTVLKSAFERDVGAGLGRAPPHPPFDSCYVLPETGGPTIPAVTLHFSDSAAVELDPVATMDVVRPQLSHACLAFGMSTGHFSIIGSLQQQRLRVTFDTLQSRIGFARESCTSP